MTVSCSLNRAQLPLTASLLRSRRVRTDARSKCTVSMTSVKNPRGHSLQMVAPLLATCTLNLPREHFDPQLSSHSHVTMRKPGSILSIQLRLNIVLQDCDNNQ